MCRVGDKERELSSRARVTLSIAIFIVWLLIAIGPYLL